MVPRKVYIISSHLTHEGQIVYADIPRLHPRVFDRMPRQLRRVPLGSRSPTQTPTHAATSPSGPQTEQVEARVGGGKETDHDRAGAQYTATSMRWTPFDGDNRPCRRSG